MRPDRVVVSPPTLDDNLCFLQRVEDLAIQKFIAQARVEAFDVAVLPRAARRDVGGLGTNGGDPLLQGFGHELGPIVGADVTGDTTQDKEIRQNVDHVDGLEPPRDPDRQALVGELVDDVEHSVLASIVGAILDEVVGPDVVAMLRPQPDARPIRQPKPAAFWLFVRNLQALTPPDPFNSLVVDDPAGLLQQPGNLAIAVAAVLSGQGNKVGGEPFFVGTAPRHLALRRAVLPERRTGATLGDLQIRSNIINAGASAGGA